MLLGNNIFYILVSKYEENLLTWIIEKTLTIKIKKYDKFIKFKIIITFNVIRKWLDF